MKTIYSFLLLSVLLISLNSCVKKEFDTPPYGGDIDPNLPVNASIWQVKQLIINNNYRATPITQDLIIYGVVTANDKSGNFYKQMIIQDSSSAIAININQASLAGDFPVGRKVYVKCKGLTLSHYGNFIQLGHVINDAGDLTDIPSTLLGDFVVKATYNPAGVTPISVSIADIQTVATNDKLMGSLIKLPRVQFPSGMVGEVFALTPDEGSGTDRTIEDCDGATMILRTSNYASFRATPMPNGSGEIVAIYSRYNSTPQLLLNDISGVKFTQDRCPFGSATDSLVSIAQIRALYSGTNVLIQNRKIRGVVISDLDETFGDNITGRNMVIQDGQSGIVIRFSSFDENTSKVGDSIEVILSGHTISEFGNLLQVGDQVTASNVQKLGTGNITPRIATVADIQANFEAWESTLVTIKNATFISGQNQPTYKGYIDINDGTSQSNFTLFTQTYAAFAEETAPFGQVKDITGFLYSTSTQQRISMRRVVDVQ